MAKVNMSTYGLNSRFAALKTLYDEKYIIGRILSQEKGVYRVICEEGDFSAEVSGKFRYHATTASDYPAVGDFVMLDTGEYDGRAIIHHVLPRKSSFVRKAAGESRQDQVVAANIDTVFLCMSLNQDFNLRRLERYLSIGWDSGAFPVVVLTKSDLCEDITHALSQVESIALGVDVVVTTALEESGISQVRPYITEGKTVAFIGSSGVGKSTLINRLLGEEKLLTNGLRNDDKGRHTTTHRELFLLSNGGMVIDTPGMRELGMWDSGDGIDRTFSDIETLANSCRFHDCTHTSEPGCAVRAAIKNGTLSEERYHSYEKLNAENEYTVDSASYLAKKERKFKEIAKANKRSFQNGIYKK